MTRRGVRKQRPHATVASPPSVRRPRQRAPPAAAAAAAAYALWHPSSGACTTHAPAASNLRAPTRPMARRPGGERKDALDTAVASRRRCRAQVASVAAAASAASLGVKPQAEAPHSAPDAPRGALRRRLRRRTTSSARARTQSHRLVAARARAGPTWESERSSSVPSRRAAKAARAQVEGKWRGNWEPLRPPTRLEPAAAPGSSTASWEVTGVLYRGGVIKLPRAFLPAAGAKILAMLTVNHYIYALKLMPLTRY